MIEQFTRLVALARQQAEANHWHMPNRPHGHHTALFEDCPHPDCVAARVDLGDLLEGASERDAIATLLSDRDEPGTYAKVEGLLAERRAGLAPLLNGPLTALEVCHGYLSDHDDGEEPDLTTLRENVADAHQELAALIAELEE